MPIHEANLNLLSLLGASQSTNNEYTLSSVNLSARLSSNSSKLITPSQVEDEMIALLVFDSPRDTVRPTASNARDTVGKNDAT